MHYIKVHSDGGSDDSNLEVGMNLPKLRQPQVEGTLGSMIASMHGVKKYITLKVIGQVEGQDIIVLIDPRASHNFIDIEFAKRKDKKIKDFEGFQVSNMNGKLTLVDHLVEKFGVHL